MKIVPLIVTLFIAYAAQASNIEREKRMATERSDQISGSGNGKSQQIVVPGADHYFTDKGDELVTAVARWLENL